MRLTPANISIIKRLLVGRNNRPLRSILGRLEVADLASLISQLNRRETSLFFGALLDAGRLLEVLMELPEPQISECFLRLSRGDQLKALEEAHVDHASYVISLVDKDRQAGLLAELKPEKGRQLKQYLTYPEDSAGRLMQSRVFTLNKNLTAEEGLEELRARAQEESIFYIYCTDDDGGLDGVISLRQLATSPPSTAVESIVKRDVTTLSPLESEEEVATKVARYGYIALPVISDEGKFLGVVTVDDVVHIIQEQATADIYASAGLQEDDRVYTPTFTSIKNRIPWMLLNLFLAALASSVVSLFEDTMAELIVLASVKNIVAGIGGNTAIQTLTVVTRGIAVGDFNFISKAKAVVKETIVGLSIGIFTGLSAGLLIYFWKSNLLVAVVICISMILNSLVAASCGALIPLALKKFNFDPATGSGVLVTMITDIFGFLSFLGIASIGLRLVAS